MTGFCKAHISARSTAELAERYANLHHRKELTSKLADEKARIASRLSDLGISVSEQQAPSLFDMFDDPSTSDPATTPSREVSTDD